MYHLTEIQNFKILKSYKTYRGAERAHNNLLKKGTIQEGRKLFFGACIITEERRNKLEKLGVPFVPYWGPNFGV